MRNILTIAALLVFVISTGLLETLRKDERPVASLPPVMGMFDASGVEVDKTAVTSAAW